MASCDSQDSPSSDTADRFLLKIASLHEQLDTCFKQYQLSLQERKQALTNELNRIEFEYKNSIQNYKEKRRVLDEFHSNVKQQCATFKSFETTLLKDVEKQINLLENEFPEKDVDLVLDTKFTEKIQKLGKLEVDIVVRKVPITPPKKSSPPPVIRSAHPQPSNTREEKECPIPRDFTTIQDPVVSAVKQGDGTADLKYPQRLAVDPKTGFVFIADQTSHCVKIFTQEGVYKGEVLHNNSINRYGTGSKVELVHPFGVCFYKDSLFVTSLLEQNFNQDFQHCVFKFNRVEGSGIDFVYSVSTGTRGSGEAQFNHPKGIAADPTNGDVYVSDDGLRWNRVQVLDINLSYKRVHSRMLDAYFFGDERYQIYYDKYFLASKVSGVEDISITFNIQCNIQQICFSGLDGTCFIHDQQDFKSIRIAVREIQKCVHRYSYLKSITAKAPPVDYVPLEIRGMALDESTQRLIIVLYSKNNMLQIF